jgi:hypothetical protein
LVVEVDHVERAVGADAGLDRPEPEVGAADKLGLLAALFLGDVVAYAVATDELVMDDIERGFAGEVAVVPRRGPSAALVNRAPGGGGEAADLVDLRIGLLRAKSSRETCSGS